MSRQKRFKKIREMEAGGRNLVLLGIFATVIAMITTGVSLTIYHNSGDIYLDRSRPGFLPDEEEAQEEKNEEEDYEFSRSGKITAEVLDELLKNLDVEVQAIDAYGEQFDESALSNERIGIPEEDEESQAAEGA